MFDTTHAFFRPQQCTLQRLRAKAVAHSRDLSCRQTKRLQRLQVAVTPDASVLTIAVRYAESVIHNLKQIGGRLCGGHSLASATHQQGDGADRGNNPTAGNYWSV